MPFAGMSLKCVAPPWPQAAAEPLAQGSLWRPHLNAGTFGSNDAAPVRSGWHEPFGFVGSATERGTPIAAQQSVAADGLLDVRTGACSMIDLKPVSASDAELIFESWGRYPQNFARLTARVFTDVRDAERYLSGLFSTPASKAFHIVAPAGTVVGIVKAIIVEHRAQVGYVVNEPFRGQGFATRAVEALVDRLEAEATIFRIWATCALDNPASTRVLEKCGFQLEGVLKNWVIYPALGHHAVDNYSYVRVPQMADRIPPACS